MILLYFKFTRTLVFTICPTVMLTKSRNFHTGHGGGTIFNTYICSSGEKLNKTENEREEKIICSFAIACSK